MARTCTAPQALKGRANKRGAAFRVCLKVEQWRVDHLAPVAVSARGHFCVEELLENPLTRQVNGQIEACFMPRFPLERIQS
jgi:hypothetical protein